MASPEALPPPLFLADHKALDFLNSVATPQDEPIEWIADGAALRAWVEQRFEGVPHIAATRAELDRVAAEARHLREWLRAFVAKHAGAPLSGVSPRALRPLNDILADDSAFVQVASGDGDGLALRQERHWKGANALLLPVANTIADLLVNADFSSVRHCEGAGCTLWFLDVSKAHRRRWCSMAICGNRAKAAAHRARSRAG